MIKIKINGKNLEVEDNITILKAAKKVGIKIPTLCYHPDIHPTSACGICMVKLANMGNKCSMLVEEGMDIITHDAEINMVRKGVLELVLSAHPNDCLNCIRNGNCELQTAAADFGVRNSKFDNIKQNHPKDETAGSIVLNPEKCIKCGRCVVVCQEMQKVHALGFVNRGFDTYFAPVGVSLKDSTCVDCGQCATHCPVAAIYEKVDTKEVMDALDNPDIYVTVQMAPSVRVALGEYFGLKAGDNITGKIYAAMRLLGFDAIFDTNFGADMTIVEEANEFVKRFTESNGTAVMTTSCCPAWVKYIEEYYPDLLDNVSTSKSPHMMLAPMVKTYYAEKMKLNPAKIYNVSIMPCTAKKNEIRKNDTMKSSGYNDVDVVITTREFARMIKRYGIDLAGIQEEEADSILGEYSGAGTIFGATGGVMEAALRTAYNVIAGSNLENVEYKNVYQGKYTYKYTHTGIVVERAIYFNDKKTRIDILPFPSSHSKGALAMLVDNRYLFVGDALYPKTKGSDKMYNVSILNEQIKLLKNLEITHIMLSHRKPFAMKKEVVIMWLLDIYNKRNKNDAFIME